MSRKPPIAKNLVKYSKAAIFAAIEMHNKPTLSYRYEIVVLLTINAWELLLKAYIYKYHKNVKLFYKDSKTKPFLECLSFVASQNGDSFQVTKENLERLYDYRNEIAHFFSEKLDIIVFGLLKRSVQLYQQFLLKYFSVDLATESDLVLLPIGFKKPYSPFDFISNQTEVQKLPIEARRFIQNIIESTKRLNEKGIEDTIIVDFKVNLINEKRTKNADIIAGIDNNIKTGSNITVLSTQKVIHTTNDPNAEKLFVTRDKSVTSGTFYHEQLSENLFNEINNIIDANALLAKKKNMFFFDKHIYFRIYAERDYVINDTNNIELLAQTGLEYYTPYLFWFILLPPISCANIILNTVLARKYLPMLAIIRLMILLGNKSCQWLFHKLHVEWSNHPQPPNYYWTLKELIKKEWKKDVRLIAMNRTEASTLVLPDSDNPLSLDYLMKNVEIASKFLSKACFIMFEEDSIYGETCRFLDILIYGEEIQKKSSEIMKELDTL
jgi:hypothetical protein